MFALYDNCADFSDSEKRALSSPCCERLFSKARHRRFVAHWWQLHWGCWMPWSSIQQTSTQAPNTCEENSRHTSTQTRQWKRVASLIQQHLQALKCMGYEPSGPFVTSVLELKLDTATMFEWQKHTSSTTSVPHFTELLEFVNLRAQASEHTVPVLIMSSELVDAKLTQSCHTLRHTQLFSMVSAVLPNLSYALNTSDSCTLVLLYCWCLFLGVSTWSV